MCIYVYICICRYNLEYYRSILCRNVVFSVDKMENRSKVASYLMKFILLQGREFPTISGGGMRRSESSLSFLA
jgi:hypothetical protein